MTRAIAKLIMTEQTHQIPSQLQTGKQWACSSWTRRFWMLLNAKEIDPDDAYRYADRQAEVRALRHRYDSL